MDENKELQLFESSKNIYDSEEQLKETFNTGYKEYDFEPEVRNAQQQEMEQKVQNLWRAIETAGLEPIRPKSKPKLERKRSTSSEKPEIWLETLKVLTKKGMNKDAQFAKQRTCNICEPSDLGQVFADEAYQDRYIRPVNLNCYQPLKLNN